MDESAGKNRYSKNRNRNRSANRPESRAEVTLVGICAKVAPAKHALYSTCCQKQEIYSDVEIVM